MCFQYIHVPLHAHPGWVDLSGRGWNLSAHVWMVDRHLLLCKYIMYSLIVSYISLLCDVITYMTVHEQVVAKSIHFEPRRIIVHVVIEM